MLIQRTRKTLLSIIASPEVAVSLITNPRGRSAEGEANEAWGGFLWENQRQPLPDFIKSESEPLLNAD